MWHSLDTPIRDWFAQGRLPGTPEELRSLGHGAPPPPKKFDNRLIEGDVFETMPNPGAGYGDPLLRRAELVAADERDERLEPGDALRIYGVVLDSQGDVDEAATTGERSAVRARRIEAGRPPRKPYFDAKVWSHTEGLGVLATVSIRGSEQGEMLTCRDCACALSPKVGQYRRGCVELEQSLPDISAHFGDPSTQIDGALVYRQYICPSCGAALDSEICRPDDDPGIDLLVPERTGGAADTELLGARGR